MPQEHHSALFKWLVSHWLWTFALMVLGFVVFGALSFNLVQLFAANIGFLVAHGLDAVRDGGLRQFAELVVNAFLAVAFYLAFRLCEHALVQRLAHHESRKIL